MLSLSSLLFLSLHFILSLSFFLLPHFLFISLYIKEFLLLSVLTSARVRSASDAPAVGASVKASVALADGLVSANDASGVGAARVRGAGVKAKRRKNNFVFSQTKLLFFL